MLWSLALGSKLEGFQEFYRMLEPRLQSVS